MSGIKARAKQAISAALFVGGLAGPGFALAADEAAADEAQTVSGVVVTGAQAEPDSPKYVAPLLDTPQTITVVPKEVIEAQNLMSLRDILSTLPGITFGAGEGGGGFGDSINLRGYSANSDITIDGIRDSAQYSRSDPFNLEQVEVVNGANGAYSGAGSVGGSINLVSKAPRAANVTVVSAGAGTDGYARATLDANRELGAGIAGRLNLMVHANDAPGRDVERFRRWGIAPSLTVGAGSMTQLTMSLFHQEDDNIPQYGVPYASNSVVNGPLPGVDPSTYFGYRNIDRQESAASYGTIRLDHAFNDAFSVRNLTRYQIVTQDLVVDPPQGSFCLASGINPQTGAACATPDSYTPSGPRGNRRDSENTLFHNETTLRGDFATGPVSHSLAGGLAFASESYDLDTGNVLRNAGGALPNPTPPTTSLSHPDTLWTGPVNYVRTRLQSGERDNQAVYLFDDAALNPSLHLNGGVRIEHNKGSNRTDAVASDGAVTPGPELSNEETLFSWRLGAVFKPAPNASLYVAYGNSKTPSQTSVSGACDALSCNVDPEEAETLEVGAKWDLPRGISLTASAFRNERDKFRVDSGIPGVQDVLDGKSRVQGFALGAAGVVRKGWSVFANYTYLDSELLQGVSDASLGLDFRAGDPLPNTPRHAFNVWTTVDLSPRWQVGYGATYSGKYAYNRAGTAASPAPLFYAPDYWVHNLAVTWRIDGRTDLRLNVRNLTDETYYTRIRANGSNPIGGFGWATPGDARNATLTLTRRL